jgi:glycosyltransferase involved in cell wall biosynthesis
MRIGIVHSRYRLYGGEDAVVDREARLLRDAGHEVLPVEFRNDDLASLPPWRAAAQAVWSRCAAALVRQRLGPFEPDVVHVHNTFPAASPTVFGALREYPVVHTVHNYRWLCPAATLLRDGAPCRLCVGRVPWPGVVHRCQGGSVAQSAVTATMLTIHRLARSLDHVDRFIALTDFARDLLIEGGLPRARIVVRRNFTPPSEFRATCDGPSFAFLGRLSKEKGVGVLAEAWRSAPLPPLEVIGEGPEADALRDLPNVTLVGALPPADVAERLARARALVMPSIWYEGLPLVILEAYAVGLPVIGSDLGAMTELIREGETGMRVPPGDPAALASAVRRMAALPEGDWQRLSEGARRLHAERFSSDHALETLIAVYDEARIAHAERRRSAGQRS